MKHYICIRIQAYIELLGGGSQPFISAIVSACWDSFQCIARERLELVFLLCYKQGRLSNSVEKELGGSLFLRSFNGD